MSAWWKAGVAAASVIGVTAIAACAYGQPDDGDCTISGCGEGYVCDEVEGYCMPAEDTEDGDDTAEGDATDSDDTANSGDAADGDDTAEGDATDSDDTADGGGDVADS